LPCLLRAFPAILSVFPAPVSRSKATYRASCHRYFILLIQIALLSNCHPCTDPAETLRNFRSASARKRHETSPRFPAQRCLKGPAGFGNFTPRVRVLFRVRVSRLIGRKRERGLQFAFPALTRSICRKGLVFPSLPVLLELRPLHRRTFSLRSVKPSSNSPLIVSQYRFETVASPYDAIRARFLSLADAEFSLIETRLSRALSSFDNSSAKRNCRVYVRACAACRSMLPNKSQFSR